MISRQVVGEEEPEIVLTRRKLESRLDESMANTQTIIDNRVVEAM